MNERESLLPKEPCPYCGKIAWTWTVENGKNVAKPHNPERCFYKDSTKPNQKYYA